MGREALNKYTFSVESQINTSRELKRLTANKNRLVAALDLVLGSDPSDQRLCDYIHHKPSERHEPSQPCPVLARLRNVLDSNRRKC